MPLTLQAIEAIQADCFAEDVSLHVGADGSVDMHNWTTKAVTTMTSAVVSMGRNSGNVQERIVIIRY